MTEAVSENSEVTVLLVDDNPQNLKVLYETLKDKGYRLLIANEGEKALDLAHRHQPEVILLDIMMPEMDGYRLTREIRDDPRLKDMFVVLHTSLSGNFNQAMVEKVGCNGFLSKFEPDKLALTVQDRLKAYLKQYPRGA